jgi:hypothetical protein
VERIIIKIVQLQAASNIMGHLSNRVFAHPTILETLALGAGPPYTAGEDVQVTADLLEVFAKAIRKSALSRDQECSSTLGHCTAYIWSA